MSAARGSLTTTIEHLALTFPRSVTSEGVTSFLAGTAAALTVPRGAIFRPWFIAEVHAAEGELHHYVHAPESLMRVVRQQLVSQLPGVRFSVTTDTRPKLTDAIELRLSAAERSLRTDRSPNVSSAVLTAIAALEAGERIVLQWVFGGAAPARVVHQPLPQRSPLDGLNADVRRERGDIAREATSKTIEPQLLAVCRVGVHAPSSTRRRLLLRGVLGALRGSDAPGVRTAVRVLPTRCATSRLQRRTVPVAWPNAVNAAELAARLGWPIDGPQVPGLRLGGSRLLVPSTSLSGHPTEGSVLALSTFPGFERQLILRDVDRLQHLHIVGPTGTGKSTLMSRIALQDIERGHGVMVLDPKGDMVEDIIDRLPRHRVKDVILIDPSDSERPVGYNPLATDGRSLDLTADAVTSVFSGLFARYWGPRTDDVLRASLLTLGSAARPVDDAFTLCEIPPLLTDQGFRRALTASLNDPIALEPFWAVYESQRVTDRMQVISPLMNKLRAFLLRKSLRTMLGQSAPKWSMESAMQGKKIVLVPLRAGIIGEGSAQLLGSLLVARLWQSTIARSGLPVDQRPPFLVHIDEFQTLVNLPTSLGDLLAQARGLGVGLTLAHQHLGQLTPELKTDVLANARSRVIFQAGIDDAKVFARGIPELEPEDLQGLPSREVVLQLVVDAEVQGAVTGRTLPLGERTGTADAVRTHSRLAHGLPAEDVERLLLARRGPVAGKRASKPGKAAAKLQIGEADAGGPS